MSQNEIRTGNCPHCGESLQVPAHLQQFSCLYCGARLCPGDIAPVTVPTMDAAASAEYYKVHVLETITNHIGIDKELTGNRFPTAFEDYLNSNAMIFKKLEAAIQGGAITMDEAVATYLDQLENRWNSFSSRLEQNKWKETDKFNVAIFLVPMVRKLNLSISEEYCKTLQETWVKRYPKSPFYLGTYEELCGGFQKKFLGLCYITTAICANSGKPDNCAELTAFRNFRDGYLRSCPDGPSLISEYYDVAPWIVLRIQLSDDADQRYAAIRETYLQPCYMDLQAGNLKQCKDRYITMVRALEREYLH